MFPFYVQVQYITVLYHAVLFSSQQYLCTLWTSALSHTEPKIHYVTCAVLQP